MLKIYNKNHITKWNDCVKSFANWDIYYTYEYAYSFMLHGDGDIYLIYFENGDERLCMVVMQSDIAKCDKFEGQIEEGVYFDWETPYGYGGPLTDGALSEASQDMFYKELEDYCKDNGIVSLFIRFHPLLCNYDVMPKIIDTRYLRDTIYIDTASSELIMSNMDSKNRNMVRKAIKSGVTIKKCDIDEFEEFIPMYNETMKKNGADEYYIFSEAYFESLKNMGDNAFIMYAMLDDKPISGSIFFYNEQLMHYHLSGSYMEYRKYSPSNLLLYEAACWGSENGIEKFHLGGGMTPDDSLFGFKKQFNKNGRAKFCVGRMIFDKEKYNELLMVRHKIDSDFDMDNGFMIQYRR